MDILIVEFDQNTINALNLVFDAALKGEGMKAFDAVVAVRNALLMGKQVVKEKDQPQPEETYWKCTSGFFYDFYREGIIYPSSVKVPGFPSSKTPLDLMKIDPACWLQVTREEYEAQENSKG